MNDKTQNRKSESPGPAANTRDKMQAWPRANLSRVGALRFLGTALIGLFAVALAAPGRAADTNTVFLFSFFRDNGQDGLFLAWSRDGLRWTELKPPAKSFLEPKAGGKLMRDPCLRQGPDGAFHLVWTTGWGQPPVIGCAHSHDLLHWSEQKAVPVMSHEPTARKDRLAQPVRPSPAIGWKARRPSRSAANFTSTLTITPNRSITERSSPAT